jgi:hypothetical protein
MHHVVYALCFAGALLCAVLLFRSYRKTRAPLLWWSGVCFSLLALNNLILVVDLSLLPTLDLLPFRRLSALGAACAMLFGIIWWKDA